MAIGLVLVIGGGLGSLLLYQSASNTEIVVGVTRSVERGHVVQRSDLVGIDVASDLVATFVPREDASSLVGAVMLVDLPAGTPLMPSMVAAQVPLGPSEVLTAVALEPGQFPPDLVVGDRVSVALLPNVTMAEASPPELFSGEVIVWSITQPDGAFSEAIITLRSGIDFSEAVARAGTARLSLLGDPSEGVMP